MGRYVFKLPDVGEGTAEAELVAWHVAVGDRVAEDQPLADVMTDKATVELTSPVAGVVRELKGEPGEMRPVKGELVILEIESGDAASDPEADDQRVVPSPTGERNVDPRDTPPTTPAVERAATPSTASPSPSPVNGGAEDAPPASPPLRSGGGGAAEGRDGGGLARAPQRADTRPLASPAVRQRALDLGIKLASVPGSGPAGRISHADLDAFLDRGSGPGGQSQTQRDGVEEVKIIGLRRRIAQQMQESKRRIPHFMYAEEVDVTELEELRGHLNATKRADQPKLTLLPFLIVGLCKVLPRYPSINARFDDEAGVLHRSAAVHLGMATQTPGGLIVPVIRHAEAMDVWALAAEIARLAQATRDGTAKKEELSGSTITLTSLGPLGGITHTPVINHPETAIVGPNKIVERPVVRGGAIVVRRMMNVSSSFDHRVVDGYDAAEMIQSLKGLLEHPATLFMS